MNQRYFKYGNYVLHPYVPIHGYDRHAFRGYDDIVEELKKEISSVRRIIVCDFYPGVDKKEVLTHLANFKPALIIDAEDCAMDGEQLNAFFEEYLGNDRVFGFMCRRKLEECFLEKRLEEAYRRIQETDGLVLVVGVALHW